MSFAAIGIAAGIFGAAALLVWAARRLQTGWLAAVGPDERSAAQERVRQVMASLKIVVFGIAAVAAAALALSLAGVTVPNWRPVDITAWALSHGIRILAIAGAAYIVVRAGRLFIEHFVSRAGPESPETLEWQRRAATLGGLASRP